MSVVKWENPPLVSTHFISVVPFALGVFRIVFPVGPGLSSRTPIGRRPVSFSLFPSSVERFCGFMWFLGDDYDRRHCPSELLPALFASVFRSPSLARPRSRPPTRKSLVPLVTLRPSAKLAFRTYFDTSRRSRQFPTIPYPPRILVVFRDRLPILPRLSSFETHEHRAPFGAWKSTGGDQAELIHLDTSRRRADFATKFRFGESTGNSAGDKRETHFVCAVPKSTLYADRHSNACRAVGLSRRLRSKRIAWRSSLIVLSP